jgi:hypothetical protein
MHKIQLKIRLIKCTYPRVYDLRDNAEEDILRTLNDPLQQLNAKQYAHHNPQQTYLYKNV